MKYPAIILGLIIALSHVTWAQIQVNPTGVNVNSQNPTTVFLTFGQIPTGYSPAEAIWCGELTPATFPALGQQCRPGTIYGALPARYNRSTASGNQGFTDIMAIPPSVVRRAYQAATRGASAGFFYVRRFVSSNGDPDQFVTVTCRMSGGGARVPFALTNVEIKTDSESPVPFVRAGGKFPKVTAKIKYNGTGRLKGRWEIVRPGEEAPSDEDLLTESTLPVERRGLQKRYTQIARFNHFLPPTGEFDLPLRMNGKMPLLTEGSYQLLLRIEASDDRESSSNLQSVGVGNGVLASGAVASFPMPVLKFFVVGRDATGTPDKSSSAGTFSATGSNGAPIFTWDLVPDARAYRLEIIDEADSTLLTAIVVAPERSYRAPSWFWTKFSKKKPSWRVIALDTQGAEISTTQLRQVTSKQ